jgi:Pyruvate/2-oxoacid:ferredoxin oxidoreductase delta subunit
VLHLGNEQAFIAMAAIVAGLGVYLLVRATSAGRPFWSNLFNSPLRQRRLRQNPIEAPVEGLEPRVILQAEKCIACQACVYLCPTRAVTAKETDKGFLMSVSQRACLFCGLCEEQCPTGALHLVQTPGGLGGADDLVTQAEIACEVCPECGGRRLPIDILILRHLYGQWSHIPLERYRVCRTCYSRLEEKIAAAG